jgi:DNA-binding CsgD family transcriptional regulator
MRDPVDDGPRGVRLVVAGLFALIMVVAGADLLMDRPRTFWSLHLVAEATLVFVSLAAATYLAWGWYQAYRDVRVLETTVARREAERDAWRERAALALEGLGEAMDHQFDAWELTPAERETTLMILKGYSHKRIGRLTDRSERTVRQHAVAVYRKAGLAGRSELSAFFLEGLLLPSTREDGPMRDGTLGPR